MVKMPSETGFKTFFQTAFVWADGLAQGFTCASTKRRRPAGQFRPAFRFPAHLCGTVHAFGVGHHNGNAVVGVGILSDALRRAVGVERIGLGNLVLTVHILQRDAQIGGNIAAVKREVGAAFAVADHDRQAGVLHFVQNQRR